jgi:hypothetical protein
MCKYRIRKPLQIQRSNDLIYESGEEGRHKLPLKKASAKAYSCNVLCRTCDDFGGKV